jgi:hypothetical protein
MDGWVDGWMDRWVDRWVDGWMDGGFVRSFRFNRLFVSLQLVN